jgi:hypothetical protein
VSTWGRWVAPFAVAAALLVALILFVSHNNNNSLAHQNPAAVARANREAAILVAADQAPHVYRIEGHQAARRAIEKGVRIEMTELINRGTIGGTLHSIGCTRSGGTAARQAFRCSAVVAGVNYPFLGVVDRSGKRLTLCKRDEPPVPSMNIPVSASCRA